jgi:hypothetical protein
MAYLQEIVIVQLENIPGNMNLHIVRGNDPASAIIEETRQRDYDLVVIGSYEGDTQGEYLFGELVDRVRRGTSTSVLVVRHYETLLHPGCAGSYVHQTENILMFLC